MSKSLFEITGTLSENGVYHPMAVWDKEISGIKKDIAKEDNINFEVIDGFTVLWTDEVPDGYCSAYTMIRNGTAALSYFSSLGAPIYIDAQ